jgi:hypothetical protein
MYSTNPVYNSYTIAFFLRWSNLIYCQNKSNLVGNTWHTQDCTPSFVINYQRQIRFWYQVHTPCHARTSRVVAMFDRLFNRLYV